MHNFHYTGPILIDFIFKDTTNVSATSDFPSLCVEQIVILLYSNHYFIDLL